MFAVLVVNAVAGERGYLEWRRLEGRLAEEDRSLAIRRAENVVLQSDVQRMRTDPAAVEEAVREELGFAKPDELVFTVKEPRPRQAPPATSTVPQTKPALVMPAAIPSAGISHDHWNVEK